MNIRFRLIGQKSFLNRLKNCSNDLIIMRADEKFRFRSVEQKIIFNRPKNCSMDLKKMHGDEF